MTSLVKQEVREHVGIASRPLYHRWETGSDIQPGNALASGHSAIQTAKPLAVVNVQEC
jgi:hypothetical protein